MKQLKNAEAVTKYLATAPARRTLMRNYRVTVEVDYVVKAASLSEAMQTVSESSEHPLVGGSEIGYCDDVRVIGGANA
jgi:hypothetical protein